MSNREDMWNLAQALQGVAAMVGQRIAASTEDPASIRILALLLERGHAHPSTLTTELGLSASAVTRRVRSLQESGEVAVAPDPEDGRAYTISITKLGRDRLESFADVTAASMRQTLEGWSKRDIATLTALLTRLVQTTTPSSTVEQASQKWWRGLEADR